MLEIQEKWDTEHISDEHENLRGDEEVKELEDKSGSFDDGYLEARCDIWWIHLDHLHGNIVMFV